MAKCLKVLHWYECLRQGSISSSYSTYRVLCETHGMSMIVVDKFKETSYIPSKESRWRVQ